ncbi:MAG: Gx transporter family protein [Firmicutes bacterium]|nr:Gx transporter family protein [Bacillota bacterium]
MTQSPTKSRRDEKKSKATRVSYIALMVTLALIFSYVEAIIPYNPGIPGIKLGVANIVTVIALYKFGWKDAAAVSVIRILIAGLLFNGLFGALYSLTGALASFVGMLLLKKSKLFSIVGVSMAGGVLHNVGQLLMAAALIEDIRIFFYFPVLLFSGLISGIAIGVAATLVLRVIKSE